MNRSTEEVISDSEQGRRMSDEMQEVLGRGYRWIYDLPSGSCLIGQHSDFTSPFQGRRMVTPAIRHIRSKNRNPAGLCRYGNCWDLQHLQ